MPHEGAFTEGGTARTFSWCQVTFRSGHVQSTGSSGYTICMIDETQNLSAGSLLRHFYNDQRLLDTDPFYVRTS